MQILVTGHTGFIGRHLVKKLNKYNIAFNVCRIPKKINKNFTKEVTNADIIIHLGGKNRGSDIDIFNTNINLTLSLLDVVNNFNPKAHILFSSSFQIFYENSIYGLSKKTCEELLALYAKRNKIKSTILRLSNVYGPGCKPFYNSVISTYLYQILHNQSINLNNDGEQKRDYIYIEDVVNAFLLIIQSKKTTIYSSTYNICSGTQLSLNDIITVIRNITGRKIKILKTNNPEPKELPKIVPDTIQTNDGWFPRTNILEGIQEILNKDYESIY